MQEMNPIICFRQVMARFRQNYSTPLLLSPASITTSKEQRVATASVVCCSALPAKWYLYGSWTTKKREVSLLP